MNAWAGEMVQQMADHHDQGELLVIWLYRLIPGGLFGLAILMRKQLKAWIVKIVKVIQIRKWILSKLRSNF